VSRDGSWWERAAELEAADDRTEQQCAARGHEVMVVSATREIEREKDCSVGNDEFENLERFRASRVTKTDLSRG